MYLPETPFIQTVLWMYAVCFVLIWIYLPLVETENREPLWLHWSSLVIHVVAFVALLIYLTGLAIVGAYFWWVLLWGFSGFVLMEDVIVYRYLRTRPEPRLSTTHNRVACAIASVVHTLMRLPCAVVIHMLAARG